jgi:hypothetical protein
MASAYLLRTPSSNGNRKTWTFSAWCKVQKDSNETIFDVGTNGGNNYTPFFFQNDQTIRLYEVVGGTLQSYNLITNRKFRDRNAWYHLVYRVDTTQSTASDRIRLYVNGVQETSFSTASYPAQDYDTLKNSTSYANVLGTAADNYGANSYDGLMAHVHFCDGYSYAPTEFGETDTTTGIWKPKTAPSVTYGTNGFFLKFDNSGNMGLDSSGQSNNFTTNGTIIQNKDTPSNVFNTLSPIDIPIAGTSTSGTLPTLSNTNASITNSNSAFREVRSNIYVTKGKYYFECKPTRIGGSGAFQVGVVLRNYSSGSGERRAYQNSGSKYTPGSSSYGDTFAASDIIGVALNLDDGEITFYKNGVSQGVAATDMITGMDNIGWTAAVNCYDADGDLNFGNGYFGTTAVTSAENPDDGIGIFEYDPPTGYRALCTKSINAQEYS